MNTNTTVSVSVPSRYGAVAILADVDAWYTWRESQQPKPSQDGTRTRFQDMALDISRAHIQSWLPVGTVYDPWTLTVSRPAFFFPPSINAGVDRMNVEAEKQWRKALRRIGVTSWPLRELFLAGHIDACYDMACTLELL